MEKETMKEKIENEACELKQDIKKGAEKIKEKAHDVKEKIADKMEHKKET